MEFICKASNIIYWLQKLIYGLDFYLWCPKSAKWLQVASEIEKKHFSFDRLSELFRFFPIPRKAGFRRIFAAGLLSSGSSDRKAWFENKSGRNEPGFRPISSLYWLCIKLRLSLIYFLCPVSCWRQKLQQPRSSLQLEDTEVEGTGFEC